MNKKPLWAFLFFREPLSNEDSCIMFCIQLKYISNKILISLFCDWCRKTINISFCWCSTSSLRLKNRKYKTRKQGITPFSRFFFSHARSNFPFAIARILDSFSHCFKRFIGDWICLDFLSTVWAEMFAKPLEKKLQLGLTVSYLHWEITQITVLFCVKCL